MKKENNDLRIAKFANVCNQQYKLQKTIDDKRKQERQEYIGFGIFFAIMVLLMIYTNIKWGIVYD